MTSLAEIFIAQHHLQTASFGVDPLKIEGEERCDYIRNMAYALEDELHEATAETGWKTWSSSHHVNEDAALDEMTDLLHFAVNEMLAMAPRGWTPTEVADSIVERYFAKRQVNADRQADGYTGLDKCPNCKRDRKETQLANVADNVRTVYCPCGHVWETVDL